MKLWIYGVVLLGCCCVGILAQTPASNRCDSSPCQHGRCVKSSWGTRRYHCICRRGYIGDNCEHESPCVNDNPCKNGGRCYASTYRDQLYGCRCRGGWYGRNCTLESPCVNGNPCKNGGLCSGSKDHDKNYYCSCKRGWYGKHCTLESACVNEKPCKNGAWCYASSHTEINYRCTCRGSYYGVNCTKVSPCKSSNPCMNSGRCYYTPNEKGYRCSCTNHHYGDNCEHVSPCKDANPCQNGGHCLTLSVANPCQLGGRCSSWSDGYRCSCAYGFGGKNCDKRDPCTSEVPPCQNGGTCSSYFTGNDEYTYYCSCPTTHAGEHCEKETPCISNPCMNGGTCSSYPGDYFYCHCIPGFRGQRCETKKCPVELNCRRNYTRTENGLNECVKQEELYDNMLESCYSRLETAIVESRSCDCTGSDYAQTKMFKGLFPHPNFVNCFSSENMASVTCNSRILECANKIRQAGQFLQPGANCSEDMLNLKSDIQQCHDDFLAGRVDFSGCELFKKAYEAIQQLFNLRLKLSCTGCDVMPIMRDCYVAHFRMGPSMEINVCENIAAWPKYTACVKDGMNANPACAGVTETYVNYMDKSGYGTDEFKQVCTEVTKYEKKLEEYGCEIPRPATITRRSTNDFEDEPFSHLLYI